MLQTTKGIVLRSVKYGETSLICSVFTEIYGVQSYLVQGVRSAKAKGKAGLLQPATLLDMVVYQKPNANLQRIKEFQPAYIYTTLQEHVVKNSVALFSVELLLRLLPEQAPFSELFELSFEYFCSLDAADVQLAGNYPLFFMIQCCNMLGYDIDGGYSVATPHLNLREGGYSEHPPAEPPYVTDDDARMLHGIMTSGTIENSRNINMNGDARFRLLDWLLAYMHNHTQHMGEVRSLPVLRAVLH